MKRSLVVTSVAVALLAAVCLSPTPARGTEINVALGFYGTVIDPPELADAWYASVTCREGHSCAVFNEFNKPRLNDGDFIKRATSPLHWMADNPRPITIVFKLVRPFPVSRVVLYAAKEMVGMYVSDCGYRPTKVRLSYRDKDGTWKEILTNEQQPQDLFSIQITPTMTDSLKVEILETDYTKPGKGLLCMLTEVEVYAKEEDMSDEARRELAARREAHEKAQREKRLAEWNRKTNGRPVIITPINFAVRCWMPSYNEDLLLKGLAFQIEWLKKYDIPGTFLLEHQVLREPRFVELIKRELLNDPRYEIGVNLQIGRELAEAAGLPWPAEVAGQHYWPPRGNEEAWLPPWPAGARWDPGIYPAFHIAYPPETREKLVDVYMAEFKGLFGQYPRSAGAWTLDAHTIRYLHEKYGVIATANCSETWGGDCYAQWGSYFNGGYYPSKYNIHMPAQTEENQLPVLHVLMISEDPIYNGEWCLHAGKNEHSWWAQNLNFRAAEQGFSNWFIDMVAQTPLSFGWAAGGDETAWSGGAYIDQAKLFAERRARGEIQLMKLEDLAHWFKANYKVTPPNAINALTDCYHEVPPPGTARNLIYKTGETPYDFSKYHRSIFYHSRFYRINPFWESNDFRIRDVFVFDERIEEPYLRKPLQAWDAACETLPVLDSINWGTLDYTTGIRLFRVKPDGPREGLSVGVPTVSTPDNKELIIDAPLEAGGVMEITCREKTLTIELLGTTAPREWAMEMSWSPRRKAPVENVEPQVIKYAYKPWRSLHGDPKVLGDPPVWRYSLRAPSGTFSKVADNVILIEPRNGKIVLDMSQGR